MVGAATGSFDQLLTYVVFAAWIFYGLGALSLFVYRRREPKRAASVPRPGISRDAVLFVAAATALVLNTLVAQPARAAVGLAIVLSGVPAFYWWRRTAAPQPDPSTPTHVPE